MKIKKKVVFPSHMSIKSEKTEDVKPECAQKCGKVLLSGYSGFLHTIRIACNQYRFESAMINNMYNMNGVVVIEYARKEIKDPRVRNEQVCGPRTASGCTRPFKP